MVAQIVAEVAQAIWDSLVVEVMAIIIKDKWRGVAAQFFSQWNSQNGVESTDWKHVVIQAPNKSQKWMQSIAFTSYTCILVV